MKNNRRVVKEGSRYYPQYKGWFLWHYYKTGYSFADVCEVFDSETDAIDFIKRRDGELKEDVVWEGRA